MTVGLDNIEQRLVQLVTATSQLVEGLSEIKETAKEQSRTAKRQQQSVEKFANIIAEQAWAIVELTRTARDSVEASRIPRIEASHPASFYRLTSLTDASTRLKL
jgi:methyl-accepting chemotaxis protein